MSNWKPHFDSLWIFEYPRKTLVRQVAINIMERDTRGGEWPADRVKRSPQSFCPMLDGNLLVLLSYNSFSFQYSTQKMTCWRFDGIFNVMFACTFTVNILWWSLNNSPFANSPVFSNAKVGSSHLRQRIGFLYKASWLLACGLCQSFIHGNVLL